MNAIYQSRTPGLEGCPLPKEEGYGQIDEFGLVLHDNLIQEAIVKITEDGLVNPSIGDGDILGLVEQAARELLEKEDSNLSQAADFDEVLRDKIRRSREVILDLLSASDSNGGNEHERVI